MVGLLQLVEAERRGDAVDRALVAQLLRCFSALGIYAEAFQAPFLQQTAEFYAAEGLQAMATMETGAHLLHCEVCDWRCAALLPSLAVLCEFFGILVGQQLQGRNSCSKGKAKQKHPSSAGQVKEAAHPGQLHALGG